MQQKLTLRFIIFSFFLFSSLWGQAQNNARTEVVGGQSVSINEIPFQVAMIFSGSNSDLNCGGAILNEEWIITAAHCVYDFSDNTVVPPSTFQVVVGRTILSSSEGEVIDIERIIAHEDYNASTEENDIALLKLASPIDFNRLTAEPIRILTQEEELAGALVEGVLATITGWGATDPSGLGVADSLQIVTTPVVANSTANAENSYNGAVTEDMLAAGLMEGGQDACSGDSGGPLTILLPDGSIRLAGITSWGIGCAEPNFPGIYARIPFFEDWIYQNLPIKEGLFISEIGTSTNSDGSYVELFNAGRTHDITMLQLHTWQASSDSPTVFTMQAADSLQTNQTYSFTQQMLDLPEGGLQQTEGTLSVTSQTLVGIYDTESERYIDVYGIANGSTFWFQNTVAQRRTFVKQGNSGFFNQENFFEWELDANNTTVGNHTVQVATNEVWLQEITAPQNNSLLNLCDTSFTALEILVANRGTAPITQLQLALQLTGNTTQTDTISINLTNNPLSEGIKRSINLLQSGTSLSLAIGENYSLSTEVISVNDTTDEVSFNNQQAINFGTSNTLNNSLTLVIQTDEFGSETTWRIENTEGELFASGGAYPDVENGQLIREPVCLPDGCYVLRIIDSFGDGIFDDGFFRLEDDNQNVLLEGDGNFEGEVRTAFCVPIPETEASLAVIQPSPGGSCGTRGVFNPQITVRNNGSNPITSFSVRYGLASYSEQFDWTGSLANAEEVTLSLNELPLTETETFFPFQAELFAISGEAEDGITTNNREIIEAKVGESLRLQLQLDDYPEENFWLVLDEEGDVIQEIAFNNYPLFASVDTTICVPTGCNSFIILDTFGDGITDGSYTVTTSEGLELATGDGNFTTNGVGDEIFDSFDFCLIPGQPRQLTAEATSPTSVQLNWIERSLIEAGYEVQFQQTNASDWNTSAILEANATSYLNEGLEAGTTYLFRVIALREGGNVISDTVSATTPLTRPTAPTDLQALNVNDTNVELRWRDNSTDETGFTLWRSTTENNEDFDQIATLNVNQTQYTDSDLSAEQTYFYKVRAEGFEPSEFSNTVTVTTLPLALSEKNRDTYWVVYPNPSNAVFTLSPNGETIQYPKWVKIIDLKGQIIWQKNLTQREAQQTILLNLEGYPKGIYILQSENGFQKLFLE